MESIKTKIVTLKDYLSGKYRKEVDFNLRYIDNTTLDLFGIGDITDCKFGFVKDAQHLVNTKGLSWSDYIEFLMSNMNVKESAIYNSNIYQLHQSRLFLKQSIDEINKLESESLGHQRTAEEERADPDNVFQKYGSTLQLDALTSGDWSKFDFYKNSPYLFCFMKLMLAKDNYDFQQRLNIIRSRKLNT